MADTDVSKPFTPKMGGLDEVRAGTFEAWTGGKPKPDWSGLDNDEADAADVAKMYYKSPFQRHPTSLNTEDAIKFAEYREKGMDQKFSRGQDLHTFQSKVLRHLEKVGMDTITYLPSPKNPNTMVSIVRCHYRFTTESAEAAYDTLKDKYDKFDRMNMLSACNFLLDTVDGELRRTILSRLPRGQDSNFILLWMHLMHEIRGPCRHVFYYANSIEMQLRSLDHRNYPGNNLKLLIADFRSGAIQLDDADRYDHLLTTVLVNAAQSAGGNDDHGDSFRRSMFFLDEQLEEAWGATRGMGKEAKDEYMRSKNLDFITVCNTTGDRYKTMQNERRWEGESNRRDASNNQENQVPASQNKRRGNRGRNRGRTSGRNGAK